MSLKYLNVWKIIGILDYVKKLRAVQSTIIKTYTVTEI